jgi:hypothetical protein
MFKKVFLIIGIVAFFGLLFFPFSINAQEKTPYIDPGIVQEDLNKLNPDYQAPAGGGDYQPSKLPDWTQQDMIEMVNRITNWAFTALLAIVVIMVIVAGIMFTTAGGNPDAQTKARTILLYALVGFAVGMIARGIIALVTMIMGQSIPDTPWDNI